MNIELSNRGLYMGTAIIDDGDAPLVEGFRWHLKQGYAVGMKPVHAGFTSVWLHRLVMPEPPAGMVVDHIDRDRLNNRKTNLRFVTRGVNATNRSRYSGSASGYRGVTWKADQGANGKWLARAMVAGKNHHLGYFEDPAEAALVVANFWTLQGN